MTVNYETTDVQDTYSAQLLVLRVTEMNEHGEPTGGVTTEQMKMLAITGGGPNGRVLGSPGDIAFRLDVPQIWQKVTGEPRTLIGWELVGGGGGGVTLCNSVPQPITAGAAGSPGIDGEAARCDHAHAVLTAAASTISGNVNIEGASASLSRADHTHQLTSNVAVGGDVPLFTAGNWVATPSSGLGPSPGGVPDQLDVGQAGAAGVSLLYARADHVHAVPAGTPVTVGQANSAGVATTFARSDHVHRSILEIENSGAFVGARPTLNFTGAGRPLTIVDVPGDDIELQFNGINVQDEGVAVGQRQILNFTGTGVTATDDAGNTRINIDIPGAGAAPAWSAVLIAGNVSGGTDPVISITDTLRGVDSAAAGTNGGVLNMRAGNYTGGGAGNDVGGAFSLLGGSSNATGVASNQPTSTVAGGDHSGAGTGDAGALLVRGGDRTNGTGTLALGGSLTLRGGNLVSGSATAGALLAHGGDNVGGTGNAGALVVRGGNVTAGLAGTALFAGGSISTGGNTAGAATLQGGDQFGAGVGGAVLVRGGDAPGAGATQNSSGSNANIRAGSYRIGIGGPAVSPGGVYIRSGQPDGVSTSGTTGEIRITTAATGTIGDMASTGGTLTTTGSISIDTNNPGATAGITGDITLQTGTTAGSGGGPGDISLIGGVLNNTGQSNAQGGQIFITGGNSVGATTSPGGSVTITAGSQTNTGAQANSPGGSVVLVAGSGAKNNAASGGGSITATAGAASGAAGPGGAVSLTAGNATNAAATGAGGSVSIAAGSVTAAGSSGSGGSITQTAGSAAGTGAGGDHVSTAGTAAGAGLGGDVDHVAGGSTTELNRGAVTWRTGADGPGSEVRGKTRVVQSGAGATTTVDLASIGAVNERTLGIVLRVKGQNTTTAGEVASRTYDVVFNRTGGVTALALTNFDSGLQATAGWAPGIAIGNTGDTIQVTLGGGINPVPAAANWSLSWETQLGGMAP